MCCTCFSFDTPVTRIFQCLFSDPFTFCDACANLYRTQTTQKKKLPWDATTNSIISAKPQKWAPRRSRCGGEREANFMRVRVSVVSASKRANMQSKMANGLEKTITLLASMLARCDACFARDTHARCEYYICDAINVNTWMGQNLWFSYLWLK